MTCSPILSIVTPTRGDFSDYWLEQLLKIEGDREKLEFVIVYPPGVPQRSIADLRIKSLYSPFKGEMIQRFVALLNSQGRYVLALDDDDFVHPQILQLVIDYFARLPDDIVLRLMGESLDHKAETEIKRAWDPMPPLAQLDLVERRDSHNQNTSLQQVPIAPLANSFNLKFLIWPWTRRRDQHGAHIENFNLKVWNNQVVQEFLPDLAQALRIRGPLIWLPPCGFDRFLGLFLQAKLLERDPDRQILGHWLPNPPQFRYISFPLSSKSPRFHFLTDAIPALLFPKYGYFWNLFFDSFYNSSKTLIKRLIKRLVPGN